VSDGHRACAGRLNGPAPYRARAIGALVALVAGTGQAMTGGSVEARFRGDWVPTQAACNSPLKLTIGANVVIFVNGGQRAEFRKLDQCFTCAAGGMTTAPQPVWLTTDAMGDSPFIVLLDGTRKTAAVAVDFSNDKKLGARFPLGTAALRRCP
jgi:hypothetical protein